MRLVKAALAAFLAVFLGCTEAPADEPLASAADCSMVITRPVAPRLRTVAPDGSVADVGPIACTTCALGSRGSFALRDGEGVLVVVGDRRLRVTPPPGTRVGGDGVPGIVLARDAAAIDRGTHLEVIDAQGTLPARFDPPALLPGEEVAGFARRGAQAMFVTRECRADAIARFHPHGGFDAQTLGDAEGAPIARVEGSAPGELVFASGGRTPLPLPWAALSATARGDKVLLTRDRERWLVWASGAVERLDGWSAITLANDGTAHVVDLVARTVDRLVAPGQRARVLAPTPGRDLAGAPLPDGGRVKRMMVDAVGSQVLAIERIENRACGLEDRVHLIELPSGAVRTVVSGQGLRSAPLWLGDRFAFVEADVDYATP